MNVEVQSLVGIGALDVEDGVVGNEFTEADGRFRFVPICVLRMLGAKRCHMHAKASEDHSGNVAGTKEEIEIVGLEGDVLDGDDGRRAGRKTKASEGGIVGFETGMRKIGRVEILEASSHWKSFFKALGDARLREGPVGGEGDAADEQSEE